MNDVVFDRDVLLHILDRLVVVLGPQPAGEPLLDGCREARIQRWEDEDYLYVEASIPGAAGSEIDINIHGALVLIRVGR